MASAWWADLPAETLRELRERYPGMSFDQMAIHAVELPGWAEAFDAIGAGVERYREGLLYASLYSPDDPPELYFPPESARALGKLVEAALLGDDAPGEGGLPRREPLPLRQVEEVVRLRVEQLMSWEKIGAAESVRPLSHRKIDYIRRALKDGDLSWDRNRLALGPETRNTPAGLVLPAR